MFKYWVAAGILFVAAVCAAAVLENKGAETIILNGGSQGEVTFPHHRHQNALADCNACHTLFPQETGVIARLKQEGKLAGKQVMNKHCISCHRAEKKAGKKAGPVSCNQCHKKG